MTNKIVIIEIFLLKCIKYTFYLYKKYKICLFNFETQGQRLFNKHFNIGCLLHITTTEIKKTYWYYYYFNSIHLIRCLWEEKLFYSSRGRNYLIVRVYVECWIKQLFNSQPVNKCLIIVLSILWISIYYIHTDLWWRCGMWNTSALLTR